MSTHPHWIPPEILDEEVEKISSRRAGKGLDNKNVRDNFVGLALSGGGIRSATFGLGVLEYLKSRGWLNQVDYLSTVSGGGYIGGWLSANCVRSFRRNEDWLDEKADWTESIRHLRRYSNYLSPKVGLLSADSWTMATVWIRNTLLVQLCVILSIALLLLFPRLLFEVFDQWPYVGEWRWATAVLFILGVAGIAGNQWQMSRNEGKRFLGIQNSFSCFCLAVLGLVTTLWLIQQLDFNPFADGEVDWVKATVIAVFLILTGLGLLRAAVGWIICAGVETNVWKEKEAPTGIHYSQGWVQGLIVIPIMVSAFLFAAVLWGQTTGTGELAKMDSFGEFFNHAWRYWPFPLSIVFVSFWLLSLFSMKKGKMWLLAPVLPVLVLHALLCAIMLVLHGWAAAEANLELPAHESKWLAFIWAPAMLLFAFSLSVNILIGMMGRQSTEGIREWWSRLGAWLGIYGVSWMLLAVAAVYGPKLVSHIIYTGAWWEGISLAGGWLVTTLAGLWAGKSNSTDGLRNRTVKVSSSVQLPLNLIAILFPVIFIAGLLVAISTGIHLVILDLYEVDWGTAAILNGYHWPYLSSPPVSVTLGLMGAVFVLLFLLAWRVDINEFSLNAFYRSRLSRCYLGASRYTRGERKPQEFTGFDERDDLPMTEIGDRDGRGFPPGPLHIVNCAMNLGGSSDLALHTRQCAPFTITPYAVGSGYWWPKTDSGKSGRLGYQSLTEYGGREGKPTLGQAISVSGAAASPNMGHHTSPLVAFMLTVFNVRLGWWFPNPLKSCRSASPWFSLRYLVKELFGGADDQSNYLMISDGGHFENLGVYELIRRRCSVIIVSDAENDPELKFESLGSLIRMCEVDFNVRITLNVDAIRKTEKSDPDSRCYAIGEIDYNDGLPHGVLIYLKTCMTGQEDTAVLQYWSSHPDFPHESTSDQFFGEDQFESYRRLGKSVASFALDKVVLQGGTIRFTDLLPG
uniref:Putative Patatin n=1 Tax=Candidatus Nitrotoga fabula TaxID=2182327 RepID=A0A2X0SIZ9_9PROT|nr:putative Patatin [Candidatus Nitrotoga fabula]